LKTRWRWAVRCSSIGPSWPRRKPTPVLGSCVRQIADCAIDRAAAELNASSFENAMALGRAMFVHWPLLAQKETYACLVTLFLTVIGHDLL
jgi:hypothetical protein